MKKGVIAERYASALLNVAKNRVEMERVFDDLVSLKKVLSENPSLRRFLESPHITQEDKIAFVKRVFSPVMAVTSINFLLILVRKYRLFYIKEIIEEYQRLYDVAKAIQRADVITAYPLDDATTERIYNTVGRIMNRTVKLCFYINPDILGGVIVKTPNRIIDGSIKRKLRDLRYSIMALKV